MAVSKRGRPRSDRAHQAILEATRDLLTGGYEQLTIEGIAARAGVGKQTVYRWWPSKAAVVAEAVLAGYLTTDDVNRLADTGDIAADLRVWLRERHARLSEPGTAALVRGLVAAAADSDKDATRLYEQFTGPFRRELVHRLSIGVQQGQLRGDADLEATADALTGTLLYWALSRTNSTAQTDNFVQLLFTGIGPQPPNNTDPSPTPKQPQPSTTAQ